MKTRKKQRKNRKRKEKRLERKNCYGNTDLTPYMAVKKILKSN